MREMIEESAGRLLGEEVSPALLAAAAHGTWAGDLWTALEDAGYTRALCTPARGGSGAAWSDVHPLLVAAGHFAVPLPLPETMLAHWLMERADLAPADGPATIADPMAAPPLSLRRGPGGWRASGFLRNVPWGRDCELLLAQAHHDGGEYLLVLHRCKLAMRTDLNMAREPRDSFVVDDAAVQVVPWPAATPGSLRTLGAVLRSAQTHGAAQRALTLSVRYANERVQFGRTLAKFQAVRQQLAAAASETAAVAAAADEATGAIGTDRAVFACAVAKIVASETASQVAATVHAVHGAIGFTAEHSLHHATQRLWSWRSEFGNVAWWSERLGRAACNQGADALWVGMVDGRFETLT